MKQSLVQFTLMLQLYGSSGARLSNPFDGGEGANSTAERIVAASCGHLEWKNGVDNGGDVGERRKEKFEAKQTTSSPSSIDTSDGHAQFLLSGFRGQ